MRVMVQPAVIVSLLSLEASARRRSAMKPSRLLSEVHEIATELRRSGAIDTQSMREFDALMLPPCVSLVCDKCFAESSEQSPSSSEDS